MGPKLIGLELTFGLRAAELAQATWSWLTKGPGYPVLDSAKAVVKDGTGIIQVQALDPYYSTLIDRVSAEGWNTGPDAYILAGCDTERKDVTFRKVSSRMRALGWSVARTERRSKK